MELPPLRDSGGITVGAMPDGRLLIDRSEKHIRFIGPTGSGKTSSFFMPTLMRTWTGSSIVHDRKGDFWLLLQGGRKWRHNLLFAPTMPESIRYNPLAAVPQDHKQIAAAFNIAHQLPHHDIKSAKEPIWDVNAVALVSAEILYVLNFLPPEEKNLAGLRRFHDGGSQSAGLMIRNQHPDPIIRREIANAAQKVWQNDNEKYAGSIVATIDSYLNVYADPLVADATSKSEFTPTDLVCSDNPVMLCLHLPPSDSDRLAPLARMMLSQIQNMLMQNQFRVGKHWKRHHLLLALDEFNRMGKMDVIEGAAADMRSYGMRLMFGAQAQSILTEIYGKNSLIFNNSRLVTLRPFDDGEAERISGMIGETEVMMENENHSYGTWGERRGSGLSRSIQRKKIFPREKVLSMSENEVLILNYPKPIKALRPPLSSWHTLLDPAPRSWKPLDIEMLPIRSGDGHYLDLPMELEDRNPWNSICHPQSPPQLVEPDLLDLEDYFDRPRTEERKEQKPAAKKSSRRKKAAAKPASESDELPWDDKNDIQVLG